MASSYAILLLIILCFYAIEAQQFQTAKLIVNTSISLGKQIPNTFMGVFFEEINHAGVGGLWAELVSNRGFEARGENDPSNIYPWTIIGDKSLIQVSIDQTSCFERNKNALKMEVHCDNSYSCPPDGIGISNPGFWGMNIEKGKKYKLVFYVRSAEEIDLKISFVGSDDAVKLASIDINLGIDGKTSKWRKVEHVIEANATNHNSSLQITTTGKGVVWLDQVSAMPLDTYKGHGFRNDLFQMVEELKPRIFRFPGGCYVEGNVSKNAFRWKQTVGSWENRPGHYGDVWGYWTDDGFGYFEGLQLAEDLNALPIWVFNNGISLYEHVNISDISPIVQEVLDGIEFARGSPTSKWGSIRASMGHPMPFDLRYVAVGNEECERDLKATYLETYPKFYDAIKQAYPDIQIISNCDASTSKLPLNHPADLYDYHRYPKSANDMFHMARDFDHTSRTGPKAFVSEYALTGEEAGYGTLLAAVAEAAFLIGLEKNSDVVNMVSYAPLFVNANDRRWNPDAIVFDSHKVYGTPSYWVLKLFKESNGATFLNSILQTNSSTLAASAILWKSSIDGKSILRIKVVNLESKTVNVDILIDGLESSVVHSKLTRTVLTSSNVMDENSFLQPNKVVPKESVFENAGKIMNVQIDPHSVTLFDIPYVYK
ncbi:alpha-L-arabinofuranosidase 1-like isoform X1 [Trifolium pratense]|uniref:alpha-L-arabinofuranosidase 1-like isoform X1 n=1 Tax=Trifolium pratense TaxID=57577 RepID=UPI001E69800E|nr:alpha-L-arabinofuranosidase 1-like isoform X1 [Trifolium pratense]